MKFLEHVVGITAVVFKHTELRDWAGVSGFVLLINGLLRWFGGAVAMTVAGAVLLYLALWHTAIIQRLGRE